MRYQWPKESVEFLKINYGKIPTNEIALKFGVSERAVFKKAIKLGLKLKEIKGEFWTREEDELLNNHFEFAPKNFLMNLFPNRTWPSIYQRGRKHLNLFRNTQDRFSINYNFFKEWNEKSAYIFGLYLADGYLMLDKTDANVTNLQIELQKSDAEILEKIKQEMKFEGNISYKSKNACSLYISNRKIALDLVEKGFSIDNKTENAMWPIDLPKDMIRHFLRGYFDGDGSIWADRYVRISFLGTKQFLEALKGNIPFKIVTNIIPCKNNCDIEYRIKFSGKQAKSILKWMYEDSTIYLDRKYNKYNELKKLEAELKSGELLER